MTYWKQPISLDAKNPSLTLSQTMIAFSYSAFKARRLPLWNQVDATCVYDAAVHNGKHLATRTDGQETDYAIKFLFTLSPVCPGATNLSCDANSHKPVINTIASRVVCKPVRESTGVDAQATCL